MQAHMRIRQIGNKAAFASKPHACLVVPARAFSRADPAAAIEQLERATENDWRAKLLSRVGAAAICAVCMLAPRPPPAMAASEVPKFQSRTYQTYGKAAWVVEAVGTDPMGVVLVAASAVCLITLVRRAAQIFEAVSSGQDPKALQFNDVLSSLSDIGAKVAQSPKSAIASMRVVGSASPAAASPAPASPAAAKPAPASPAAAKPAPVNPTAASPAPVSPTAAEPAPVSPTAAKPAPVSPAPAAVTPRAAPPPFVATASESAGESLAKASNARGIAANARKSYQDAKSLAAMVSQNSLRIIEEAESMLPEKPKWD